jgi:hypothetical protein
MDKSVPTKMPMKDFATNSASDEELVKLSKDMF